MKKKFFYTKPMKLVVVLVLCASAVLTGISGAYLVFGRVSGGMTLTEMFYHTPYEQSEVAADYLINEAHRLARALTGGDAAEEADDAEKDDNTGSVYEDDVLSGETAVGGEAESRESSMEEAAEYEIIETEDEPEETNAMLYLRNGETGEVYTNIPAWERLTLSNVKEAYLTDCGDNPVYYSAEEEDWDDRTWELEGAKELAAEGNSHLNTWESYLDTGTCQVFVALDTRYPLHESKSYNTKLRFEMWEDSRPFGGANEVILFFAMLALAVFAIVLASCQTGHKKEDAAIHPARMDRFPIELMMAVDVVLWVGLGMMAVSGLSTLRWWAYTFREGSKSSVAWNGVAVIAAAAAMALLLVAWECKRYGRRVKAHALGGSLIARAGRGIRGFLATVEHVRAMRRCTVLLYVGFLAVQVVAAMGIEYCLTRFVRSFPWIITGIGIAVILVLFDLYVLRRLLRELNGRLQIREGMAELAAGNLEYQVDAESLLGDNREMAEELNGIREGVRRAVDAEMKSERMKTELITNVSHDIKTPLTSILNYVDILKRENIADEKIAGYIDVLDRKSQRLKQLTDDLMEASKISSGNVSVDMRAMDFKELILQLTGEFDEKWKTRDLTPVLNLPEEEMRIRADGRHLSRVIENLLHNAEKYAMPGSRVYIGGTAADGKVAFTVKNISEHPLNISADELTERFVRGDASRTTEGSGLGLEIAKNLTSLQGGSLELYLDGDLFKVTVTFDALRETQEETS